ncbi:DUF6230 family protein [Nonomuraea sp. B19D2]|uniref:DUF6230 family protein n=1 Tax=Nonomuraea sp. B19D2 TaxID=3159561 RepID=UPI0032DA2CB3
MLTSGRICWKRFLLVLGPAIAVAGLLAAAMSHGAVGATMVVSGRSYKISAKTFKVNGFAQYGRTLTTGTGSRVPVMTVQAKSGLVYDMCQSMLMDTPVGTVTLKLRAGHGGKPAVATDMLADATRVSGDTTFVGFEGGVDAGVVSTVPGVSGTPGTYGQRADKVVIRGFRQVTWGTATATFDLPGLTVDVERGRRECF